MTKHKVLCAEHMLKRLKTLRRRKNLKEENIAHNLGIDRSTYVGKENGVIPITIKEWLRLADVMDVKLVYFFKD